MGQKFCQATFTASHPTKEEFFDTMPTDQGHLFFEDNGQTIRMLDVPIAQCRHSRFNTRKTRSEKDIQKLADRMRANGFERTRALWAVQVDGYYEIFAGGTRLQSAKHAELSTVPIMLHVGYPDQEISRRADVDNENDEYHAKVPLPDEWEEIRRLYEDEEGWTQDDIANAKKISQTVISQRVQFAKFPTSVLRFFIGNEILKESHAEELARLLDSNMSPWLTRDDAMREILERVVGPQGTHRGKKAGESPTAEIFRKHVESYNTMVQAAKATIKDFPESVDNDGKNFIPREAFLDSLAKNKVRVTKDVIAEAGKVNLTLQSIERRRISRLEAEQHRLTEEQAAAEREAQRLEEEAQRKAYLEHMLARLQHGDCRKFIPHLCPENVQLVLTDPPYGKQFKSNRRVVTEKKSVMEGDDSIEQAAMLLRETLDLLKPKLASDAHLFIFTHQDSYEAFCDVIRQAGLTLRRTMTWLKGNHGMGDVTGGESLTETEWIIHAVHGNPKFTEGINRSELLDFPGEQDTDHPAEKPIELLRHLIQRASEPGKTVIDPFAGTANSLLAIIAEGRQGWACELSEEYYRSGAEKLYQFVTKGIE
jgi:ParB/RepB/Spo0J family partition protein